MKVKLTGVLAYAECGHVPGEEQLLLLLVPG